VVAGTAHANTTGADFSVRRINNSGVDVLVKNGRVDISIPATEAALPVFQSSPLLALTATSGESISLRANSVYARERLSAVILERRTAWTDGWLWFTAEPLPQALAQFNRYHEQQLVLVDRRLAGLQVGGRFRSADLDSFIATLEHSFDVQTASAVLPGAHAPTIYLTERCPRASQQCN
jgi:transmembrane sensor